MLMIIGESFVVRNHSLDNGEEGVSKGRFSTFLDTLLIMTSSIYPISS